MTCIKIDEYVVIVRRDALLRNNISLERMSEIFDAQHPFDQNCTLVSFGPCFGGEAADEFCDRLAAEGLIYVDDYFVFLGDFPSWAQFKLCVKGL